VDIWRRWSLDTRMSGTRLNHEQQRKNQEGRLASNATETVHQDQHWLSGSLAACKPFVYGGLAACLAEFATFPIDTAKTRLQLQGQATDRRQVKRTQYRGMIHCIRSIVTQEGFTVLYSGIHPALLRQAVYGTFKYGLYFTIKDLVGAANETPATNFLCAVTAGAVSSAIANPTDVLKVRLQSGTSTSSTHHQRLSPSQSPPSSSALKSQTNVKQGSAAVEKPSFMSVMSGEGVRGLWRGVGPTAARAALVAGVQLPTYEAAKKVFQRSNLFSYDSAANHLVSSFVAGLCACLISSPCDVVRTRMMDQKRLLKRPGDGTPVRIYKTAIECFAITVRNEGFPALYRGFVPAFMRMGPWNIIFFLVYERLKLI